MLPAHTAGLVGLVAFLRVAQVLWKQIHLLGGVSRRLGACSVTGGLRRRLSAFAPVGALIALE